MISSNKAASFGVFQQSLLFPNERINSNHGRYDIFMGISKENLNILIITSQCFQILFIYTKSFFRLFGELYMDDLDTAEQDFNGDKICQSNITITNYADLEGNDRCPSLVEKSAEQFIFRVVLYGVIFTINLILVNILIGTISNSLSTIKGEEYYLYSLEVKARFYKNVIIVL